MSRYLVPIGFLLLVILLHILVDVVAIAISPWVMNRFKSSANVLLRKPNDSGVEGSFVGGSSQKPD